MAANTLCVIVQLACNMQFGVLYGGVLNVNEIVTPHSRTKNREKFKVSPIKMAVNQWFVDDDDDDRKAHIFLRWLHVLSGK